MFTRTNYRDGTLRILRLYLEQHTHLIFSVSFQALCWTTDDSSPVSILLSRFLSIFVFFHFLGATGNPVIHAAYSFSLVHIEVYIYFTYIAILTNIYYYYTITVPLLIWIYIYTYTTPTIPYSTFKHTPRKGALCVLYKFH